MGLFDLFFSRKNSVSLKSKEYPGAKMSDFMETLDGVLIKYRKNVFSKSIRITPKTDGTVLVTLPRYTGYKKARDFVRENLDWIKRNVSKKSLVSNSILSERRALAHKILPQRLDDMAKKFGFKYKKLFIKNHKTIWGSCSGRDNINLNMNLVALDDDCIDYVLLHELTHTVHKNHQKEFYNLLTKNMPNALEVQKKLRKIKLSSL